MSGKGGSVVGNADDQSSAIFRNIVNPIGDSDPDRIGAEVVIIDATRSRFPTLTRIFEIPDEFAFLGVYADDGQMTTFENHHATRPDIRTEDSAWDYDWWKSAFA